MLYPTYNCRVKEVWLHRPQNRCGSIVLNPCGCIAPNRCGCMTLGRCGCTALSRCGCMAVGWCGCIALNPYGWLHRPRPVWPHRPRPVWLHRPQPGICGCRQLEFSRIRAHEPSLFSSPNPACSPPLTTRSQSTSSSVKAPWESGGTDDIRAIRAILAFRMPQKLCVV